MCYSQYPNFISKAGEDDSLLEINKKTAGRVMFSFAVPLCELCPFFLSFIQIYTNIETYYPLFVSVSTDWLKYHSDLPRKGVR